jgi:hypothetical protein
MTAPSISVITPCYNGGKYLRETIESVLAQTYPPLEMIVVDDGSTDDSAAIAESFGPPVRVIRQTNQGESAARNRGIAEARGDYLHFLDADDLLHPEAFARLADAVRDTPGAVALMGCAYFTDDPQRPYAIVLPRCAQWFPDIIQDNLGVIHGWLLPKRWVVECGAFSQTLAYFEDWDLWCQVALRQPPLIPVPFVGCYYRRFPQAQSYQARKRDRALGHATVMQRLIAGMRQRPVLLERYAVEAFWGGWAALTRAHYFGATWPQLQPLACELETLVHEGPRDLRRLRFAQLIRWLGLRRAWWLRRLVHGRADRQALLAQEVQEQQHRVLIGSGATADTTAVPT